MTDREKVIKGLEEAIDVFAIDQSMTIVEQWVVRGALALLKAQVPKVMSREEVLRLKFDDVVFFEMSVAGVVISAIVIDVIEHMPDGETGLIQFRHIQEPTNNADLEYYGKTWRCWTSRPTDEQREAVKWE